MMSYPRYFRVGTGSANWPIPHPAYCGLQGWVFTQLIMIVEVFISKSQTVDSLLQKWGLEARIPIKARALVAYKQAGYMTASDSCLTEEISCHRGGAIYVSMLWLQRDLHRLSVKPFAIRDNRLMVLSAERSNPPPPSEVMAWLLNWASNWRPFTPGNFIHSDVRFVMADFL